MNEDLGVRINKYLSEAGVCSRREADKLIEQGLVFIDGKLAENGMRVYENDTVSVNGKVVSKVEKQVYLAFNKPSGIVCTAEKKEKNNIINYINYPQRITYAGRLDKDSTGLIILTNDGDIINKMMKARNHHEKEYIVRVKNKIDADFIKRMSEGIYLDELEVTTRKCIVKKIDEYTFNIILTQGLNRQIRRMCKALGNSVVKLHRVRVMNVEIGDLKEGKYRELTSDELCKLKSML